jgi:transposase
MPLVALLKDYILGHDVIHVDETPVSLLAPGKGKTKKAYVWVYRTTNFVSRNGKGRAVYYDFCTSRSGEHPRRVLADFSATMVTDDYSGYHASHRGGVTAALCWAHARRKLFEAHRDTGSEIAGQAVALIAKLYEIEREAREFAPLERQRVRQLQSKPIVEALHRWLVDKRLALAKADVTARAASWTMVRCRSTTTRPKTQCVRWRSVAEIGCSSARSKLANAPATSSA